MRIGILQFSPRLGEPERNRARADELLAKAGICSPSASEGSSFDTHDSEHVDRHGSDSTRGPSVDLLVLPEMVFSGYNFPNLPAIQPFLEPTAAGPSARWAARTARRLNCLVSVGYPETTTTPEWIPSHVGLEQADSIDVEIQAPEETRASPRRNFNSLVIVDPSGTVVAHYRKTHLYYTDATWAAPSPSGFIPVSLPLSPPLQLPTPFTTTTPPTPSPKSSTTTSFAICMDLNPQYFTAPWTAYEAASAAQSAGASLFIASNAWISSKGADPTAPATEPDWDTLTYWLDRLRPLLEMASTHAETLVVVANRTGIEPGPCRAFELDPAVRAAKRRARREERDESRKSAAALAAVAEAIKNEAELTTIPGAEPVAVPPPVVQPLDDDDDEDEKGTLVLEEVCYAGSSTILALGGGRARVWGVLGRGEEGILIADTMQPAKNIWRLSQREE